MSEEMASPAFLPKIIAIMLMMVLMLLLVLLMMMMLLLLVLLLVVLLLLLLVLLALSLRYGTDRCNANRSPCIINKSDVGFDVLGETLKVDYRP